MSDLDRAAAALTPEQAALASRFFRPRSARNQKPAHLYVIQASTGQIKVGRASFPESRLKRLQTGSPVPLELVAVVKEAGAVERHIHSAISHYRLHGEWYEAEALPFLRAVFAEFREEVAG